MEFISTGFRDGHRIRLFFEKIKQTSVEWVYQLLLDMIAKCRTSRQSPWRQVGLLSFARDFTLPFKLFLSLTVTASPRSESNCSVLLTGYYCVRERGGGGLHGRVRGFAKLSALPPSRDATASRLRSNSALNTRSWATYNMQINFLLYQLSGGILATMVECRMLGFISMFAQK